MCRACEATAEGQRLRAVVDELAAQAATHGEHPSQSLVEAVERARTAYRDYHEAYVLNRLREAPGPFYVHLRPRDDELARMPDRHRETIARSESLTPADFFDE